MATATIAPIGTTTLNRAWFHPTGLRATLMSVAGEAKCPIPKGFSCGKP
jgi:hypothetical protein